MVNASETTVSNAFYESGENRATKVSDLFGAIAHRYDLINDLQSMGLHRRWKQALLKLAAVRPGDTALDVCCGTGDISFALQEAGATVTGLDFSPAMLAVAAERTSKTKPTFVQGDAMALPFPERTFDIVTVGYGLRNLASWERGLEEMARVAKPGGRLLVLEFGKPRNRVWRWIYFNTLRYLVPLFGRLFCKNAEAYAYIFESLKHYPAQEGVTIKLTAMGCTDVAVREFLGGAMSLHYAKTPTIL